MRDKEPDLVEAALIHQGGHAFACGHAATLPLLGQLVSTTAQIGFFLPAPKFLDFFLHHGHGVSCGLFDGGDGDPV